MNVIMEGQELQKFAIVQFQDATVEIIKTKWAFFDERGKLSTTMFPNVRTSREIEIFLQQEEDLIDETWYDSSGDPYKVTECFIYVDTYKEALTNLNYVLLSHYELNGKKIQRFTKFDFEEEQIIPRKKRHSQKKFIITGGKVESKFKTPRLCGYSTRQFRRIVQKHHLGINNLPTITNTMPEASGNSVSICNEAFKVNDLYQFVSMEFQESSQTKVNDSSQVLSLESEEGSENSQNVQLLPNNSTISHFLSLESEEGSGNSQNVQFIPNNSTIQNDHCNNENWDSNVHLLNLNDSASSDEESVNTDSDSSYENFEQVDDIPYEERSNHKGNNLKQALIDWTLKFHITLVALTALLLILGKFVDVKLPLDGRTLLGTLRKTETSEMGCGLYHHFGLKRALNGILQELKANGEEGRDIKLIFNIDGLPVSKSGTDSVWMIMCSELNCNNVYPVGAFYGKSKPEDANEFLRPFVNEAISLCGNGLENPKVNVSVEAIVCDVPAKAFAFYLKGHTGYDSCTKCYITGKSVLPQLSKRGKKKRRRVCFPGIYPFQLKTDAEFNSQETENNKKTILMDIPRFGCVSSVPLDYLHLILLGVTKTLIKLWFTGPYQVRLNSSEIQKISERLLHLRKTIPAEFNRKPRTLLEYKYWKGTEFRTFLLYSGVVALQGILKNHLYNHFLLLHTAVSILISKCHLHDTRNIDYAHELLTAFVKDFSRFYGPEYVSHNVHNLLHICNDVKKYGQLDNFSTFRFENYFSTVKGMIRTGDKPLQQIARRYSEMEKMQKKQSSDVKTLLQPHCSGPVTEDCPPVTHRQYKVLKNKHFCINCNNAKDRCVLLNDGSFLVIENVVQCNNKNIYLIGKKLQFETSLYNVPDSKQINIHIMDDSNKELYVIPFDNVAAKVWKIPSSKGQIVMPLLHYC